MMANDRTLMTGIVLKMGYTTFGISVGATTLRSELPMLDSKRGKSQYPCAQSLRLTLSNPTHCGPMYAYSQLCRKRNGRNPSFQPGRALEYVDIAAVEHSVPCLGRFLAKNLECSAAALSETCGLGLSQSSRTSLRYLADPSLSRGHPYHWRHVAIL